MPSLTPVCSFESLHPEDLAASIKTSSGRLSRQLVSIAPLGLGYEQFLKWSIQDIDAASASANADQMMRYSVNALMNARRSLSCLADQYLVRDCFRFCRDVPREANKIAELLERRGVFDSLAGKALRHAVGLRNRVEHDYEQISLKDAQVTVQLIRSTIENCVAKSNPYQAPALFGRFLGGYSGGPQGEVHHFDGWHELIFLLARCESPPWFGVVIPSSSTDAIVLKVPFSEMTCDQLLNTLLTLETLSAPGSSIYGEQTFVDQLTCLGLR